MERHAGEQVSKATVERLRGPVGSSVRVASKRDDSPELLQLELVRDIIRMSNVNGALRAIRISPRTSCWTTNQRLGTSA